MSKVNKMYLTSALALSLALLGCSNNSTTDEKATETNSSSPAQSQATVDTAQNEALTGTVVDTFDSGGYTYMELDNGQEKMWVAIGQAQIDKGQEVSLINGPVMKDFHSPSLDRTFEAIVFSPGLTNGAPTSRTKGSAEEDFMATLQAGHGAETMDKAAATGGSSKAIVAAQDISVPKAEGATGRTIEELFAEADQLNGQKVMVRGKVVKVTPGVMGVNWLHLQDGSGSPEQKSHDLVITTDEMAEVDSVILVEGTVAAKKDFGMGYYYDALVEKAVITQ